MFKTLNKRNLCYWEQQHNFFVNNNTETNWAEVFWNWENKKEKDVQKQTAGLRLQPLSLKWWDGNDDNTRQQEGPNNIQSNAAQGHHWASHDCATTSQQQGKTTLNLKWNNIAIHHSLFENLPHGFHLKYNCNKNAGSLVCEQNVGLYLSFFWFVFCLQVISR